MYINVSGPLGYRAAEELFLSHRDDVKKRFSAEFIGQFLSLKDEALKSEDEFLRDKEALKDREIFIEAGQGGICAALWQLCESYEALKAQTEGPVPTGCRIDLDRIPVKQEVIEMLELFGESPYECDSRGAFVWLSEEWNEGSYIGRTTEDRARVIEGKEIKRFLTPPLRQEKDIMDRKKDRS